MKKVLKALFVLGLCVGLTACGSDENKDSGSANNDSTETSNKVKEVLTFETYEENGYGMVAAKDNGTTRFFMYQSIPDDQVELTAMMGIKEGTIVYCVDGSEKETYFVNENEILVTNSGATVDSMKANMDAYLSEKGMTLDQINEAFDEYK